MENNYEKVMSELNFSYNDLKFMTYHILKKHFWGHRELWDEMEDESKMVFLDCLMNHEKVKSFAPYLHVSLLRRFKDMVAEKNRMKSFRTFLKQKTKSFRTFSEQKNDEDDIFKELEIEEIMEEVNNFLNKLEERDREIFEYSFGINGKSKKTETELATTFNLTRERIAEIKNDILKQIKKKIN